MLLHGPPGTGKTLMARQVQTRQHSTKLEHTPNPHTHIHTQTHIHTYIHVHTRIKRTHTHTYTHVHTRSHTYPHIHTRTHTFTHVHTRSPPPPHLSTATHVCAHTFMHPHTYVNNEMAPCTHGLTPLGKIGQMLQANEPKLVNGPEILNKVRKVTHTPAMCKLGVGEIMCV